MTRKELMKALKERNITFKATMKNIELETLLKESEKKAMKEEKKATTTKKNDEKFLDICYIVPSYMRSDIHVKKMSNNSCSVKQDKKRLFRLDKIKDVYQLTSDRDTLAIDDRVELLTKKNNKTFYRFRGTKKEVTEIMKKVLAN
jgi:hypothetical protein